MRYWDRVDSLIVFAFVVAAFVLGGFTVWMLT